LRSETIGGRSERSLNWKLRLGNRRKYSQKEKHFRSLLKNFQKQKKECSCFYQKSRRLLKKLGWKKQK
jgi:hypothetical protein